MIVQSPTPASCSTIQNSESSYKVAGQYFITYLPLPIKIIPLERDIINNSSMRGSLGYLRQSKAVNRDRQEE